MDLENISSDIMDKVITEMNSYHYNSFSNEDIKESLNKEYLSIKDFQVLLSPRAINYLEEMAQKAKLFRERYSNVEYIGKACKLARKYFNNVGIEIYPVNIRDYEYLNSCGADYVTIFQETYNNEKYKKLHLEGHKKVFSYRFNSQERSLMGGMRGVGFGALLGLDDFRKDAFSTGYHAYLLQKKYPYAEISISCPRLRPVINNLKVEKEIVTERELFQIICAYRLFLAFANITISTRENSIFRDNIIKIAATKISAGVDTGIGAHTKCSTKKGDEQFEIADKRTVAQIFEKIKSEELQPVMNDYIYLKD